MRVVIDEDIPASLTPRFRTAGDTVNHVEDLGLKGKHNGVLLAAISGSDRTPEGGAVDAQARVRRAANEAEAYAEEAGSLTTSSPVLRPRRRGAAAPARPMICS